MSRRSQPWSHPRSAAARSFADSARRSYGDSVEEIIERFDIKFSYIDFGDFGGTFRGRDRSILINKSLEQGVRRRVIAHELAHYILDLETGSPVLPGVNQLSGHVYEDYFAAEMILPLGKLAAAPRSSWSDIANTHEAHESVLALQARELTPDIYMVSYSDAKAPACVNCAFSHYNPEVESGLKTPGSCELTREKNSVNLVDLLTDQVELDLDLTGI